MSKAFTSEETPDELLPGRLPERARPGEERPISAEGHRALVERRRALLESEKPTEESALREYEHRLALVSATLDSVRVTEKPDSNQTVAFAHTVEIEWEDGRRQRLTLVGPDEAEVKEGRISIASPLARALVGLARGEGGELSLARGVESFEILSIE